jgi:ligand-binding sensor domain-containing protein/signal transduction histidine kinase
MPGLTAAGLLFALAALFAQCGSAAPGEFLLQRWDSSGGLPHNTVRAIAQTPDGYMWIGTENGLARFDGVRFENFIRENTPALPNPNVEFLQVDSLGTLWVGSKGHMAMWDGRRLTEVEWPLASGDGVDWLLISRSNELVFATGQGCIIRGRPSARGDYQWTSSRPAGASTYAVDARGDVWQLTLGGRLLHLTGQQADRVTVAEAAGRLNKIMADEGGRLWLGAEHGLLFEDGGQWRVMTPPPGETNCAVSELFPLAGGWIGAVVNGRLWRLKGAEWKLNADPWPVMRLPLNKVLDDRQGNSWFSRFGSGLVRLGSDGRLVNLSSRDGLPADRVRSLFQDHEGNIWVGIDRGGLIRLRQKQFQVLDAADGLSDPVVLGICEDQEGALWASTYGGGLNRWANGTFSRFNFGPEGSPGYLFTVFPDREGRIWVGTRDSGVFVREGGEFRCEVPTNVIKLPTRAIFQDRGGAIWLGSGSGVYRWQAGKLEHFSADTELAQADVRGFAEDAEGALWIGTHGNGLHRFIGGRHTPFHVAEGLPNEYVRTLFADGDGAVWVGMYGGGLLRWKDGALAQAAPRKDLPDDVICNILDDGTGQFWISTHHGLFRAARTELNAYAEGRQKNVTCVVYGKYDGLPTVEFSGGIQPASWRAADGKLWFATDEGLVSVHPGAVSVNKLPPPVAVESMMVDGRQFASSMDSGPKVLDLRDNLRIPAGKTQFEFHFTGLSYTAPDNVRFQYRLEGLQKEWVDAGAARAANYNYLQPGRYKFHVRAANNDGVWNETGATVSFDLQPRFWQRWWFGALIVLAVIGMAWIIYYIRMARLWELERLRLRIARDLHDDVGANLASMALIAEAMGHHPESGDAGDLRRIAIHTIDSLRDIVWFIDPARDRLGDLESRMSDTAPLLLTGIRHEFKTVVPNPELNLPLAFRRNVFPIFKEALHNAASHSKASRVGITLDCRNGFLRLRVEDDGVGFDEKKIIPGNGLRNLRRRASEMHGNVRISTSPGKGTVVEFEVPFPQTRGFMFQR